MEMSESGRISHCRDHLRVLGEKNNQDSLLMCATTCFAVVTDGCGSEKTVSWRKNWRTCNG